MPQQFDDEIRFRPTSGRVMGSLAVIAGLGVVAIGVVDPGSVPAPVLAGAALFAVLAWASMLWPRVSVTADDLVLRTMVEHQHLPLAAIEDLAVRQVLAVRVGDKRYVSSAVGKPWRKTIVEGRGATRKDAKKPAGEVSYVDHIEQTVRSRMEHARAVAGIQLLSDEQLALASGVRRQPAWLPIGLIAAAVLALLVSILV
jgi:hypothetical protein